MNFRACLSSDGGNKQMVGIVVRTPAVLTSFIRRISNYISSRLYINSVKDRIYNPQQNYERPASTYHAVILKLKRIELPQLDVYLTLLHFDNHLITIDSPSVFVGII